MKTAYGEVFFRTTEGPDRGRPVSIMLEPQDSALKELGIVALFLRAEDHVSLEELNELRSRMHELLTGKICILLG